MRDREAEGGEEYRRVNVENVENVENRWNAAMVRAKSGGETRCCCVLVGPEIVVFVGMPKIENKS